MAQSHQDQPDHGFMERLQERAEQSVAAGASTIAGGKPDETPIREWKTGDVHCIELPADEQGILRISIGGGSRTLVAFNYCTFRGLHGECVDLLRKVLLAMEHGDD